MRGHPQGIHQVPPSVCKALHYLFTDLDDTVTQHGLLPAESYQLIWELHRAGIRIVPVTGRPAGWCDHLARMWPVAGVVGENGAFFFSYDRAAKRMQRHYLLSQEERTEGRRRLEKVRERVMAEVPGAGIAADQPFRITDLAIDFCEDVAPLPREQVRRIAEIAAEEGAVSKISSIHVNCWYGDFDKISCVKAFVQEKAGLEWERAQEAVLFIGDSPNDEPMFRETLHSIGVANLRDYLEDMRYLPAYITREPAAQGFVEAATTILNRRSQ